MLQKRSIKSYEVEKGDATHIEVELYYNLGGWNFFTGTEEIRGLYLSVSPVSQDGSWRSYKAFSGVKKHLLEMKRFSQKKLDEFEVDQDLIDSLVNHVLMKNSIELKTPLKQSA